MEIAKNILENLMITYIDHKKMIIEMEKEHGNKEGLYEDAAYNFHKGCCETAENWMKSVGVNPQCNFIIERL